MRLIPHEEIAYGGDCRTVEPDFDQLSVAGQDFGQLLTLHDVVASLQLGRLADAAGLRAEVIIARTDVDTQLEPMFVARCANIRKNVAMTASPRSVANPIVGRFGLPHAETTQVLSHEDDIPGPEADCGLRPLVRIQFPWIDLRQRSGEVVRFRVLPGTRREVYEHAQFEILPCHLIGGREGAGFRWTGFARCLTRNPSQSSGNCPAQGGRQSKLRGPENHLTSLHSSHPVFSLLLP